MLSIVIPLYNECDSLCLLFEEISDILSRTIIDAEIVFIDDGSTDRSWDILRNLQQKNCRVRVVRFRRNFGKAAALTAGFRAAQGDVLITLDADLQDDPNEIPHFLQKISEGYDLVCGWKSNRLDPLSKVLPSRVFNLLVNCLSGMRLHDHNCGMKCYRSTVVKEISLYGDYHRFIPVLAHAKGFQVTEIAIHHRPRKFGHSKYGFSRFLRGFTDLLSIAFITGFGKRPQHLLGGIGMFFFSLGSFFLLLLSAEWIIRLFDPAKFSPLSSRPLLLFAIGFLLFGSQMLSLSLLSSLINATAERIRTEDGYSILLDTGAPSPSPVP